MPGAGVVMRRFRCAERLRRGAAAAVLATALAHAASADVIDMRPDGTTEILSGPVIATTDGNRPIVQQPIEIRAAPAAGPAVSGAVMSAASRYQISHELIEAIAWQESRFDQRALSPRGARGVMQLMPDTAHALGVNAGELQDNVSGGARYLSLLLQYYDGDIIRTLSAYNAGPAAVARYGGEPPFAETRGFVDAVLGRLAAMSDIPQQSASESAP